MFIKVRKAPISIFLITFFTFIPFFSEKNKRCYLNQVEVKQKTIERLKKMNNNSPDIFMDRQFIKVVMMEIFGKKDMREKSSVILKESYHGKYQFIKVLFKTRVKNDDARFIRFDGLVDLHCNNATNRHRFK